MSQENVDLVREGFDHFVQTGDFRADLVGPDFVWDMSTFHNWPEQQTYEGIDGAREFITDWVEAWDEWTLDVEGFHDAGERVVVVARQQGRSKATGLMVDMRFAQVFTLRNGKQVRMEMYADVDEALEAVGLASPE